MLISSFRLKANVGNRVIRLSLFFLSKIFFFSLFHSSVTPCPSFVKYERRRVYSCYVQPPRRRRRRWRPSQSVQIRVFFLFRFYIPSRIYTFDSFVHPQVKRKGKKKGRNGSHLLPPRQLNSYIFSLLFFASVIFFLLLFRFCLSGSNIEWKIWKENIYNRKRKRRTSYFRFLFSSYSFRLWIIWFWFLSLSLSLSPCLLLISFFLLLFFVNERNFLIEKEHKISFYF